MVESDGVFVLVRDQFADPQVTLSNFLFTFDAFSPSRLGVLNFE